MEKHDALSFVKEKMGYGSFCRSYMRAREKLQEETSKLLSETLKAEQDYRECMREIETFPDLMTQLELETANTENEASGSEIPEVDYSALDEEEAVRKESLRKTYAERRKRAVRESEAEKSARQTNYAFQNELFKMRAFYNRLKPYKEKALERISVLKETFPSKASAIDRIVSSPLTELTKDDLMFEKELERIQKSGNASKPVKYLEMLDYIIRPSLYTMGFFSEKEFAAARSGMAAVMIAGVAAGFKVSPLIIPLSCIIAFIVPVVMTNINNAKLTREFDVKEVNLLHTVLCFEEADIERFARQKEGLPSVSADDFKKQYESQIEIMTEKLNRAQENEEWLKSMIDAAEEKNPDIMKQLGEAQKKCSELSKEINAYKSVAQNMEMRLRQIEGTGFEPLEERMKKLDRDEKLELERITEEYAEKRENQKHAVVRRKTDEAEKKLAELKKKRESLENEKQKNDKMFALLGSRASQLRSGYEKSDAMLRQFEDPAFWNKNLELWKENSRDAMRSDVKEYFVGDSCYIIGPLGPFLLEHRCRPCVLLYEDSGKPLWNTISTIRTGIVLGAMPGLAEFAIVDENPNDLQPEHIEFYGKGQLDLLDKRTDERIRKLQSNAGSYGQTVKDFNRNFSREILKSGAMSGDTMMGLLLKTQFVFIVPPEDNGSRPMDNERLWEKIHGNCCDYGFVPFFLIPESRWEKALNPHGSDFSKAMDELRDIAENRIFRIKLN